MSFAKLVEAVLVLLVSFVIDITSLGCASARDSPFLLHTTLVNSEWLLWS
eukprot:m.23267 g.23267  ORF g.23267 m.23267 type:complete len:50 (+) comp7119_c0_seq1:160-309(+)